MEWVNYGGRWCDVETREEWHIATRAGTFIVKSANDGWSHAVLRILLMGRLARTLRRRLT
jgi:hypothetical protein